MTKERFLNISAAALLVIAACKLVTVLCASKVLKQSDPLWGVPYVSVSIVTIFVELAVVAAILSRRTYLAIAAVTTLGAEFLIYRLVFITFGLGHTCPCVGNASDWIARYLVPGMLSTKQVDLLVEISLWACALFFFLFGALFWLDSGRNMQGLRECGRNQRG